MHPLQTCSQCLSAAPATGTLVLELLVQPLEELRHALLVLVQALIHLARLLGLRRLAGLQLAVAVRRLGLGRAVQLLVHGVRLRGLLSGCLLVAVIGVAANGDLGRLLLLLWSPWVVARGCQWLAVAGCCWLADRVASRLG